MILSFRTDRSRQTVQTHIRLLPRSSLIKVYTVNTNSWKCMYEIFESFHQFWSFKIICCKSNDMTNNLPLQSVLLHYIIGVGRGPGFFAIDPLTGEISITNDLRNGNQLQYRVRLLFIQIRNAANLFISAAIKISHFADRTSFHCDKFLFFLHVLLAYKCTIFAAIYFHKKCLPHEYCENKLIMKLNRFTA